jgi:release factor glutamine methyltransferase
MTVEEIRRQARALFASPTPLLDCDCLLAAALRTTRTALLAHGERALSAEEAAQFRALAEKRRAGLPIAYLTGTKEFFGISFAVSPAVLIPNPDTELLVEKTFEAVGELAARLPARPVSLADVCTGSGCVAVAVAANAECPLDIAAFDLSANALAVAAENARRNLPPEKLRRLRFVCADLFGGSTETFDLVASNPPYVPSALTRELLADGRGEPALALDGGADGLDVVRRLAGEAWRRLSTGGYFLLETGEYHSGAAQAELARQGFADITVYADLSGLPRVIRARRA